MPPKKTTTPMTDEAIRALIAQGVTDALAEHEANRSRNEDDNHDSGSDGRRRMPVGNALTWWNSHVRTVSHEVAYGMTWKRMFPEESDEVEKYVGGLPDMIQGSVMASKLKTMPDAIEFATELMDQKIRIIAERQAENKSEKKEYAGTLLLCNKCKFHHNGPCIVKCANCKRVGHLTRDCWSPAATNNQRTLTCYECGNQGHYRSDFPELKNQNHGNQTEGIEARGMVYALGGVETDQDLDDMEDDINA
ncbi:reverse transcriptase domain-containing protein [Tanacetum coccineum]